MTWLETMWTFSQLQRQKLDSSFPNAQFLLPTFEETWRLDLNHRSGGILVYIKASLPSKILSKFKLPIDIQIILGSSPVAVTSPSDFAPASSKEFVDIRATIECGFTLKRVCDMTKTYSQIIPFEINLRKEKWLFVTIYKPPSQSNLYFLDLLSDLLDFYS